ncbi:MAG: YveK family protein, partial [Actinomycetota bacterium]
MTPPDPLSVEENPARIREYFAVLRLRKWSILLLTVLAAGAAFLYSSRQTPIYESTAKVLLKPATANQVNPDLRVDTVVDPETEEQIVHSTTVAKLAAASLGLPESEGRSLLSDLSVSLPPETRVMIITFTDKDPERARDVAQAFAASYVDLKTTQTRNAYDKVKQGLQKQIDDLTAELATADEQLATAVEGSVEQQTAQSDHDLLVGQIAILRNEIAPLLVLSIDPGDVIQAAGVPAKPVSPIYPLNVGLGFIAGLALGIGVAFLRERLDDRVKDRADLEECVSAPALAVIPKFGRAMKRKQPSLITAAGPRSPASEAYRALRASMQYAAAEQGVKTVLITSPLAGEGKTTTAANLAAVLAAAGKSVIVVSADLRKPKVHEYFGLRDEQGLSDVLMNGEGLWENVQDTTIEGLRFLGSGHPVEPVEILESRRMEEVLSELR